MEVNYGELHGERSSLLDKLKGRPETGIIISFLVIILLFILLTNGKFARIANLTSVLKRGAELSVMAIGIAFVLISGEIDLSVGSLYGLGALSFVLISNQTGGLWAFLFVMLMAVVVGFFNGVGVTRWKLPSLIVTLGFMMFLRGIIYAVTGGFPRSFKGGGFMKELFGADIIGGFNISLLWLILIGIVGSFILYQTRFGNYLLAVGGNQDVARAMGVEYRRVKILTFMICSALAAFAGILSVSRINTASATTGTWMELEAIASAVMGGCLLTGGYGTILGPIIGALMLSSLNSGLIMAGAPAYWYRAFVGIILVIASAVNLFIIRRVVKQV